MYNLTVDVEGKIAGNLHVLELDGNQQGKVYRLHGYCHGEQFMHATWWEFLEASILPGGHMKQPTEIEVKERHVRIFEDKGGVHLAAYPGTYTSGHIVAGKICDSSWLAAGPPSFQEPPASYHPHSTFSASEMPPTESPAGGGLDSCHASQGRELMLSDQTQSDMADRGDRHPHALLCTSIFVTPMADLQ